MNSISDAGLGMGKSLSCRSLLISGIAILCMLSILVDVEIHPSSLIASSYINPQNWRRLASQYSSGEELAGGEIMHKDLFPLDSSDWWGTIFVGLGTMVAASGGIGGGGILVPILILVYNFHPKYAIPLSNFTIVGSSITNMIMNLPKRHPDPTKNRPLVDWDLILVMEPMTMAGAIVGAIVAQVLPEWFLVISLVALLAFTTKTTLEKGMQQWNKESDDFEKERQSELQKARDAILARETESLLNSNDDEDDDEGGEEVRGNAAKQNVNANKKKSPKNDNNSSNSSSSNSINNSNSSNSSKNNPSFNSNDVGNFADFENGLKNTITSMSELDILLEEESHTPMNTVYVIIVMVAVVIGLNLLKGGGGNYKSPLGIECGTNAYWFMTFLVLGWVVAISIWARSQLVEKWKLKTRLNYKFDKTEVQWNEKNTLTYPAICFFAGFCAGMFGVGGGIVKGPLMLHMGIHPMVASGTVAVMIMFTSVAATVMFITFGTLTWDYAVFLFIIGFVTTFIGQFGVSYLVQKYKRASFVSFSIGAVVAISTVLMSVQSVMTLLDWEEGHGDRQGICGGK